MDKERLFDPVRGKSVQALPEERVRRQLVDWLIASVGVPPRLIGVEFPLSQLDPLCRQRADVVVWRPSVSAPASPSGDATGGGGEAGGLRPWLLAECKAPGVRLGEDVTDQVRGYAARVRAEHVLVTNGPVVITFRLSDGAYVPIAGLPPFSPV